MASSDSTIVLKTDPGKWIGFLLFALFASVVGVFQSVDGRLFWGVLLILSGIVGTVVSIGVLCSPLRMALRLTPEGFAFGTLRKQSFYKWRDVVVFGVGSVGVKRTCFTLRSDFSGEEHVRAINPRTLGFDRFLPDTYGRKPMELARLMEDWRYRYTQSADS